MSSSYVRTTVKNYVSSNLPLENLIDLSGEYREINSMLNFYGLSPNDNWLGIQFVPSIETVQAVSSNNSSGCYREYGSVYIHVVEPTNRNMTHRDAIILRAESVVDLFRGERIGDIVIDEISPTNFEAGATLQFDQGFDAGVVIVGFYRDNNF